MGCIKGRFKVVKNILDMDEQELRVWIRNKATDKVKRKLNKRMSEGLALC